MLPHSLSNSYDSVSNVQRVDNDTGDDEELPSLDSVAYLCNE